MRRLYDRHADAVVGYAWVRRSALRWRRAAWLLWGLGGVAAVISVLLHGPGDERVVRDTSMELLVSLVVALLLVAVRVKAVVDPDDGEIGIRG